MLLFSRNRASSIKRIFSLIAYNRNLHELRWLAQYAKTNQSGVNAIAQVADKEWALIHISWYTHNNIICEKYRDIPLYIVVKSKVQLIQGLPNLLGIRRNSIFIIFCNCSYFRRFCIWSIILLVFEWCMVDEQARQGMGAMINAFDLIFLLDMYVSNRKKEFRDAGLRIKTKSCMDLQASS